MCVVYCRSVLQLFPISCHKSSSTYFLLFEIITNLFSISLGIFRTHSTEVWGCFVASAIFRYRVANSWPVLTNLPVHCSQIFLLGVFLPFPILVQCTEAKFYDSQILNALRNCTHMKPTETFWAVFTFSLCSDLIRLHKDSESGRGDMSWEVVKCDTRERYIRALSDPLVWPRPPRKAHIF